MKRGARFERNVSLNLRAVRYMARRMGMGKPTYDHEQNWILGHMATFAIKELDRMERAARKAARR